MKNMIKSSTIFITLLMLCTSLLFGCSEGFADNQSTEGQMKHDGTDISISVNEDIPYDEENLPVELENANNTREGFPDKPAGLLMVRYVSFDDAVVNSYSVLTAKLESVKEYKSYREYEFSVIEIIKGKMDCDRLIVQEINGIVEVSGAQLQYSTAKKPI